MGNNKKTVKCSFCGKLGHNRVSCPKLKELIEKEREEHGSDHPDVKLYDRMSKGYSKKSSDNANKTRHCSYCFQPSHNVRSCEIRSKDISKLKKRNTAWRNALISHLKDRGIGLGSIMTGKYSKRYGSRAYNKGDKWILTAIEWDLITFDRKDSPELVFKLVNLENSSVSTVITISRITSLVGDSSKEYHWDVISPSTTLNYPEGWDTVSDVEYDKHLVSLFKGMGKKQYEDMISFSYEKAPHVILEGVEEMLLEAQSVCLTHSKWQCTRPPSEI